MWALKKTRNSTGETEECFCKPIKGGFAEFGQKKDLLSFIVSPKSNFKIEQPFQKFLCTWAVTHPPQQPGPAEEAAKAPQPLCHDLGPADTPNVFSLFPQPRGERQWVEGHIPPRAGGIGMGLAQEAQPGSKSLHSNFPIILTQLVGPSTVSSAARLVWNMPLCSFKPVLVGHERGRLGSAAVEKQCAKSTTAVFMRLASVLWLCHEWGQEMGWMALTVHQGLRARERRNMKCGFGEPLQACRFSGHNRGCWASHGILCLRP